MAKVFVKKKDTDAEDSKLLGAKVPNNAVLYMSLFCLATGQTKSKVLRSLITDFIEETQEQYPKKELIKIISKVAYEAWVNRKTKRMIFHSFLRITRLDLAKNSIPEDLIDKIIIKVKAKYDEAEKKS